MKKGIQFIIFVLVFAISGQELLAGGGWPQPKGRGFFKLTQWWLIADQHYTSTGLIDPNLTNGIYNTSLYGEYGFTDRLTGVLYFPFLSRAYFNNSVSGTTGETLIPGEAINSVGDTDLGIKYAILKKGPVALSATLTLGIPLGNDSGGTTGQLQTGDGEFNQLIQVDAGTGFRIGKLPAYANVYTGFNNRTNGFSDEFRYGAEVGVSFLKDKRLTAIFRFYGVESFQNGTLNSESTGTSIFANNSEHLTFAPEIAFDLTKKWGVSVGTGLALRGRLIYAAPSYNVGVYFKL